MDYTQAEHPWASAMATLVVRKEDLAPAVVSTRLGLEPTGTRAPGPDRWDPEGDQSGLWLLAAGPGRAQDLAGQLAELAELVEAHAEQLGALRAEGYEVTVIAFGFVGNVAHLEISPECARRLGTAGIALHLDPSTNSR